MEKKIIAGGNEMKITYFQTNGLTHVQVYLTELGEDECEVFLENGIIFAYKNHELVVCTNLFKVDYIDKTWHAPR